MEKQIMKTLAISLILTVVTISCSSNDKQAQLNTLESQRDALTEKITQLKLELALEDGAISDENTKYVDIATVEASIFKHYIKVQGTVGSDNNILIPPQASGIVKSIHVNEGDKVSQGQLLAVLDGSIYESTISELETNLELVTTIFERQERLWNKKIGSEIQYLQAKANKESLEKKLVTVNKQYDMTKITAPINGTVDEVIIRAGEMAMAGMGAIRIVQLSKLKIDAVLSENYISQVKRNDSVSAYIPVLEKEIFLKVKSVSQVIDPKNRTFNIELNIPKTKYDIKPNMMTILTINNYINPAALTVPINIIQRTNNRQFIFVVHEKSDLGGEFFEIEKRFIKTGNQYENSVEVIDGLSTGEMVVTVGFQDLAEGEIVKSSNKPELEQNN